MDPGDTDENFSFPLIEFLDQVFEETLEEVNNHNSTEVMVSEEDLHQSQVKVNFTGGSGISPGFAFIYGW